MTDELVADTESLWSRWADGSLCFQSCGRCGVAQHPPGPICSHCHATELSLVEVSGEAELLSWSTVHRAPTPTFEADVPYTIAVVRIAEGALVELRATGDAVTSSEHWSVGDRALVTLAVVAGWVMPVVTVGSNE